MVGRFFKRLIGIMKRSPSKQIGKTLLTFDELKDALMDVELFMNNRPLTYLGEEAEQQVLNPNTLIKGSPTRFPVEDLEKIGYLDEDKLVTKRMIYMQKTRDLLKKRWQTEYLHALRDQRNKVRPQEVPVPGSVVLITDHLSGIKPQWSLGKVLSQIRGRDGVIRGLRLKNSKGYEIERPLELVRPLEIQCAESTTLDDVATASADGSTSTTKEETSTTAEHAQRRGKRQAAKNASAINKIVQEEELHTLI